MKNSIFKYLKQHCSTSPKDVDRLIISSFLKINNLSVHRNSLLKEHLIDNSDSEEYNKLEKFISIINNEVVNFDFEILIELFEFVISPADKEVSGAIYTPSYIRKFIVKSTFEGRDGEIDSLKISDIACGCGGFLFDASCEIRKKTKKPYSKIFKDQIYGLDIKVYSINRTKLLLSLLALKEGEDEESYLFNVFEGDSLDFSWKDNVDVLNGFNIILGNPPYVRARNLEANTKEKLTRWEVCKSGNTDLYIPFFQIAIEHLSPNGIMGFITMNSFFKSLNGRALREYFYKKSLAFNIIDFGAEQIFKSNNTYTCICLVENKKQDFISYTSINSDKLNERKTWNKIYYNGLDAKTGWNLKDNKLITKIESTGKPLGELYRTRHGIATLMNEIYIFKPINEDKDYYYLQNGSIYKIEKGICRDIVNSNKFSRKISINRIKEKIIFPYNQQDKPKLLDEDLIRSKYPEAYKYLKNKREILDKRDKGKGEYENWFAFGRTQSLEKIRNKMFFPKYSDRVPNFIINSDEDLLFYNGLAIVGSSRKEMVVIRKIMESSIFWYYIKTTSKPYTSNYFSLNGNYIKNFGICELSKEEKSFLIKERDKSILDEFFKDKYEIDLK